jgi:hypothetical protein
MWFRRTASDELMGALAGPLHSLIERRNRQPELLDVQLRQASKSSACWASLYVGLSSVLDVHEHHGSFHLKAHPTYQGGNHGFESAWLQPMTLDQLTRAWPSVESYLDSVIGGVNQMFTGKEGPVHAAMCSGVAGEYLVINREAAPSFWDDATKASIIGDIGGTIGEAITKAAHPDNWWPGVRYAKKPKHFGTSPDILAIDQVGRLLVIEAKPPGATEGITWGPAQVGFYARMWSRVYAEDPRTSEHLQAALDQRVELGLSPKTVAIAKRPSIVPVLAIGPGRLGRDTLRRVTLMRDAVATASGQGGKVATMEIWFLDRRGAQAAIVV